MYFKLVHPFCWNMSHFYRNMQLLVTQFFLSKRTFIYLKIQLNRMALYNHVVN